MPFVAAKCTQCGANLEIDSAKDAAICPNCNTPFVVEKAVNYHNNFYQNNYKIENSEVHIYDEKSIEIRLKNAETFWVMHKDKVKARQLFEEVSDNAPDDYRGWWGLARVDSQEFAYIGCGEAMFRTIEEYVRRAFNVASPEVKEGLDQVWNKYVEQVGSYKKKKYNQRAELVNQQRQTEERRMNSENLLAELQQKVDELTILCTTKKQKSKNPGVSCYVISGLFVFAYGVGLLVLVPLLVRWFILKRAISDYEEEIQRKSDDINGLYNQINQMNGYINTTVNNIQVLDRILQ